MYTNKPRTVQVNEEFSSLYPNADKRLCDVWPKSAIIQKATETAVNNTDIRVIMDEIAYEWDEGKTAMCFIVMELSAL